MKIIFGFNDIKQDGMGSEATTLMRVLKSRGITVQPIHAWKDIQIPGYIEEFKPIFISEDNSMPQIESTIKKMVDTINSDPEVKVFSHFGSPNWACVVPYLRDDIRIVVSCHSITPSALKISLAYKERVSAFIAVSWEVENRLRKKLGVKYDNKIYRITNAVDTQLFLPKSNYKQDDKTKIIFFGRIEDVTKGCDKIPAIAKKLKSKGLNFVWDLYGYFHWGFEDRFYPLIKEFDVEDVINYCGCLNPDEIPSILKEYDIMVMPSNHEGFGLALAEAMSTSLACVASRIPNVTDKILEDGIEGVLCNRNDIDEFADKIYKFATDCHYRECVGKSARIKVETEFSLKTQADSYVEMLEEVISNNSYDLIDAPDISHFKQPEIVKPHILARLLPLWLKRILKKYI